MLVSSGAEFGRKSFVQFEKANRPERKPAEGRRGALGGILISPFSLLQISMVRKLCSVSIVLLVLITCGCGPSGPIRAPVSGTVLLDGEPMEDGVIYFKKVQEGAMDRMEVVDGKFAGLVEIGDRRVEVCRFREGEPFKFGNAELPNRINTIDPLFNTNSKLMANVTEDGPNEFTFEVVSAKTSD